MPGRSPQSAEPAAPGLTAPALERLLEGTGVAASAADYGRMALLRLRYQATPPTAHRSTQALVTSEAPARSRRTR